MDILVGIIIWSLIIYRVADDIVRRDGPFEIFMHIRSWAYHADYVPAWISNGLICSICVSWWLALAVSLYYMDFRYFACAGVITLSHAIMYKED
jgi:hypothetical protein